VKQVPRRNTLILKRNWKKSLRK